MIPLRELTEPDRKTMGIDAYFRVITFTGSRSINRESSVYFTLDSIIERYQSISVLKQDMLWITGGADGIDRIVAKYAREAKIDNTIIPALWDIYGKKAGALRNMLMVDLCNVVVGFWDGESSGTKQCLDYARSKDKQVHCFTMKKPRKI